MLGQNGMSKKMNLTIGIFLLFTAVTTGTGCFQFGPSLGIFSVPIPVSPFYQKQKEDEFIQKERYDRVPVLDAIPPGEEPIGLDPPSDDEVMRALEKAHPTEGNLPFLYEKTRDNIRITVEKVSDFVDKPRVLPLVGPVQLHHVHYKCTIYYKDVTRVGWPVPHTMVDEDAREVIYIDHDHLHRVGDASGDANADSCCRN